METNERVEVLRTLADHLTDIVWMVSVDSQIFFSNRHWLKFSKTADHRGEQPISFPPADVIHTDDLEKLADIWTSARAECSEFRQELRIKRAADGQFVWHAMRAWPVSISAGSLDNQQSNKTTDCWMIVCTDIHELKTVQAMFQLVMDNIPISIFWKDRNSRYLGCNKSFAGDVGKPSTEALVGFTDYENPSTKEQSDFFVACDQRVMNADVAEYHIIEPQSRPDGKQAWLDTNKIPLHDAGGNVIGVLGMYEDITERITIEQQREDFVATLTHDLKNPLLGTNRVLDLLIEGKMGELDGQQREVLGHVKDSNNTLITMVQNLLDVYRYDSIKRASENVSVDLNNLLLAAVNHNKLAANAKHIQFALQMPEHEVKAEASGHDLGRVVQNLFDNALKFTPEGGRIEAELRDCGHECQIEVRDNGPGIDLEEQKKLFHRFWQGAPGKKYAHGTGLGLYLCKQIVEAHRGKIVCESSPGRGACFTITLPTMLRTKDR